jgi:hypothetical protein
MVYFVLHNNTQEGPYTPDEVKRRLNESLYSAESLCWREGWEEWRPIASEFGMFGKTTKHEKSTEPTPQGQEISEPPAGWHQERSKRLQKKVVLLGLAVLLLGAASAVLAYLLVDSRAHIQRGDETVVSRAELERGLLRASTTLRGPQAADEIRTWVTYEDSSTGQPIAVARANILIYPESQVAEVLQSPASGGVPEMMARLQSSLPPPWRENITDSNGVARIGGLQPGNYIVIVFAQKNGAAEPEDYVWVAKRHLDIHPSQSLVLSEKNATTAKSTDFKVIE